jgi:hypothetical protein
LLSPPEKLLSDRRKYLRGLALSRGTGVSYKSFSFSLSFSFSEKHLNRLKTEKEDEKEKDVVGEKKTPVVAERSGAVSKDFQRVDFLWNMYQLIVRSLKTPYRVHCA